jgi:hypothetical protein
MCFSPASVREKHHMCPSMSSVRLSVFVSSSLRHRQPTCPGAIVMPPLKFCCVTMWTYVISVPLLRSNYIGPEDLRHNENLSHCSKVLLAKKRLVLHLCNTHLRALLKPWCSTVTPDGISQLPTRHCVKNTFWTSAGFRQEPSQSLFLEFNRRERVFWMKSKVKWSRYAP